MVSKTLVELENPILKFKKLGNILYIISGKEFVKVDCITGEVLQKAEPFFQNNKTRDFVIDKDAIYCRDFYRLYKIELETMEIIDRWELGSDLSSDVCALGYDETNIYVCIRNGGLSVIHKNSGEMKSYKISESSIWDIIVGDYIYAGNVEGELLVIDKADIKILKKKAVHKKNLKSLLPVGDVIYTASQDLSVAKVDTETLVIKDHRKRCHKKMFYFAGTWRDFLLTVCPPCGEMKLWNSSDLSLYKAMNRGTWDSFVEGDFLYEKIGNSIVATDLGEWIDWME